MYRIQIEREKDRVIEEMENSEFPVEVKIALVNQLKKMDFVRIFQDNYRKDYPTDYVQDTIIKLLKKRAEKVLATMDKDDVDFLLNDVVYEALPSL